MSSLASHNILCNNQEEVLQCEEKVYLFLKRCKGEKYTIKIIPEGDFRPLRELEAKAAEAGECASTVVELGIGYSKFKLSF